MESKPCGSAFSLARGTSRRPVRREGVKAESTWETQWCGSPGSLGLEGGVFTEHALQGRAWATAVRDATQGAGPGEPCGEGRLTRAGTCGGKAAAPGGRRVGLSPSITPGLFPAASEAFLGAGGRPWAQTQRRNVSEDPPGHPTPAAPDRAHLGPSWPVSPARGMGVPPARARTHSARAHSAPLLRPGRTAPFVVRMLHLPATGGAPGGERTGPTAPPPAPSSLRAISQAPQARSGPRSQ